jgi:hypothetical protein
LHWGTAYSNDQIDKTKGVFKAKRTKYSDNFHVYGLEWSQKYLFMWLDGRLRVSPPVHHLCVSLTIEIRIQQVISLNFESVGSLWKWGGFSNLLVNGTAPDNPWVQIGGFNAPFDQEFYLILNVAVGSTNGYFP